MNKTAVLGLPACVSLIMGNMVGSGIFLLPVSLAAIGSISIIAWLVTSAGALCLAVLFGQLSQKLPVEGGPYAYCRYYLGDLAGFQVSLAYLFSCIIGDAATVIALMAYLTVFWPDLAVNHWLSFLVGSMIIWCIAIINILGVRTVKAVQITTTIIKLIPIILVAFLGLFHLDFSHFEQFNRTGGSNLMALANAAMFTLFAFGGLESATIPANKIKNPEITIKRATIIGTILTALIYIFSTVSLMGIFSPETLSQSHAPFAQAGQVIFGFVTHKLFSAAAIISCFCAVTGFMFIVGHAAWAAAADGLLPKIFAKETSRGNPYIAFISAAILMNVMISMTYSQALTSQFTVMVTLCNFFGLIPYLFTSVAAIVAFKKGCRLKPILVALLSCIYSVFAIIGSGQQAVFYGTIFLFMLTPMFAFLVKKPALYSANDT